MSAPPANPKPAEPYPFADLFPILDPKQDRLLRDLTERVSNSENSFLISDQRWAKTSSKERMGEWWLPDPGAIRIGR
jgi:hypothetical protein